MFTVKQTFGQSGWYIETRHGELAVHVGYNDNYWIGFDTEDAAQKVCDLLNALNVTLE